MLFTPVSLRNSVCTLLLALTTVVACKARGPSAKLAADSADAGGDDSRTLHPNYVGACGSDKSLVAYNDAGGADAGVSGNTVLALADTPVAATTPDLPGIKKLLTEQCGTKCHHPDSDESAGSFEDILNVKELTASGVVVPGDPDKSRLIKRVANGTMPKGAPRLSDAQVSQLKDWIKQGAPDINAPAAAPANTGNAAIPAFISDIDKFACIAQDLAKLPSRHRPFTRYVILTHLYNGGRQAELDANRQAVSKLLNSLSWRKEITVPLAIDPANTIYRIDLRSYQWNTATWDAIQAKNPYSFVYASDTGYKQMATMTGSSQPFVRADWLVAAASRPPLYETVLRLGGKEGAEANLEKLLNIDSETDISEETVVRSGFRDSGVSNNNRIIERHKSPYGAYWKSYDFDSSVGEKNIFQFPLESPKSRAGGELIFNLPNGLQAYLLINNKGERLDEGPIAIVQHKKRKRGGFAVLNGVSCMDCHSRGIISKDDQIRAVVQKAPVGTYQAAEKDQILALYRETDLMQKLMDEDAARFKTAVEATGGTVEHDDTVFAVADHFDDPLDQPLAAAEVGLTLKDFKSALAQAPNLSRQLAFSANGSVDRQLYLSIFGSLVTGLNGGDVKNAISANTDTNRPLQEGSYYGTFVKPLESSGSKTASVKIAYGRPGSTFVASDIKEYLFNCRENNCATQSQLNHIKIVNTSKFYWDFIGLDTKSYIIEYNIEPKQPYTTPEWPANNDLKSTSTKQRRFPEQAGKICHNGKTAQFCEGMKIEQTCNDPSVGENQNPGVCVPQYDEYRASLCDATSCQCVCTLTPDSFVRSEGY